MIVTIQAISQEFTKTGAEYRKVTGVTSDGKQTTKSVFDNLKDKWPLLKENVPLEFKMVQRGQFWNVTDIAELTLPPPTEPAMLPEHEGVVAEAVASVVSSPPNPQAVGMITKELGDMIRAGILSQIFGKKIAIELTKWYRAQALGITRIPYDGKDLPQYKED